MMLAELNLWSHVYILSGNANDIKIHILFILHYSLKFIFYLYYIIYNKFILAVYCTPNMLLVFYQVDNSQIGSQVRSAHQFCSLFIFCSHIFLNI